MKNDLRNSKLMALDVPFNKVAEWLLSRNLLAAQWPQLLKGIYASIKAASNDSTSLNAEILQHIEKNKNQWNYQRVCRLMECLSKTPEFQQKNLFGQHTTSSIVQWTNVLKNYRKGNIYLADLSRSIIQYVLYDIPNKRRTAELLNKQVSDLQKRQQEVLKQQSDAFHQFKQFCSIYEFSEEMDAAELRKAIKEYTDTALSNIFNSILEISQNLYIKVVPLFHNFMDLWNSSLSKEETFVYWNYLVEFGNKEIIELALVDKRIRAECEVSEVSANAYKTSVASPSVVPIDFDIKIENEGTENVNAEIGVNESPIEYSIDNDDGIAWDVDVLDVPPSQESIVEGFKPAQYTDSLQIEEPSETVLQNKKFREFLINDIMEMNAFLSERLRETLPGNSENASDNKKSTLHTKARNRMDISESISLLPSDASISLQEMQAYKADCLKLLNLLNGSDSIHLLHLQSNPKYLERFLLKYSQLKYAYEKPQKVYAEIENRIQVCLNEIWTLNEAAKELREESLELKTLLETEIGQLLDANVSLIGEIERL